MCNVCETDEQGKENVWKSEIYEGGHARGCVGFAVAPDSFDECGYRSIKKGMLVRSPIRFNRHSESTLFCIVSIVVLRLVNEAVRE